MLELKNITKTYQPKNGAPVQALKDVSLSFEDKGMVFVLGKSGSGKSTLLNIIGGLDFADSGEISIEGKSTKQFKEKDYDAYRNTYIGFVFQEYNILNEFTVGENISLALELQNRKGEKQKVEEILKEVDLEGYADRKSNELSGGQRQRVAIARAIIKEPKIVMADEPTGALDSETGRGILETLKRLSRDRLVIVVSHDREFAEEYGDRIIELADGEVIGDAIKNTQREEVGENSVRDKESVQNRELKKSKLPYTRALAMGAKTLKRKKLRLATTVILCFFSFIVFGLAVTASGYSGKKTKADYLINMYEDGIIVSPALLDKDKFKGKIYGASYNDLKVLREQTGIDFEGVMTSNGSRNYSYYKSYLFGIGKYYSKDISGALPASQELFDAQGYKLYGRLPENEDEFVITKYIYDKMAIAGLEIKDPDTREKTIVYPEEIADIQSFLDKKLRLTSPLTGKPTLIVGVVDTKFNPDGKFDIFKEKVEYGSYDRKMYNLDQEFEDYLRYGYFDLAFVYPQAYQEWEDNAKIPLGLDCVRETGGYLDLDGRREPNVRFKGIASDEFIRYTDKILWIDGKGDRRELANNEIILGIDIAMDGLYPISESIPFVPYTHNKKYFDDLVYWSGRSFDKNPLLSGGAGEIAFLEEAESISLQELEMYKDYCKQINYVFTSMEYFSRSDSDSYRRMEINTMQEKHWRWSYACYLGAGPSYDEKIVGGLDNNVTGRQSGRYIRDILGNRIYLEYRLTSAPSSAKKIDPKEYEIRYDGVYSSLLSKVEFVADPVIVGVYIAGDGIPSDLIINNKMYTETVHCEKSIYSYFIAPKTYDKTALKKLVDLDYDFSQPRGFEVQNYGILEVTGMDHAFGILVPIFLGVAGVLGVFCILLMGSYISLSISAQKRQIGILRALGATKSDIFAIFANESAIIAGITLVLSVIVTLGLSLAVNAIATYFMAFTFKVLYFGILQIVLLALVCIGVAVLSSAIPLYKLSKKRPIECIQDR